MDIRQLECALTARLGGYQTTSRDTVHFWSFLSIEQLLFLTGRRAGITTKAATAEQPSQSHLTYSERIKPDTMSEALITGGTIHRIALRMTLHSARPQSCPRSGISSGTFLSSCHFCQYASRTRVPKIISMNRLKSTRDDGLNEHARCG